MELIDRQALRAAHGLGTDCHECKRDMKSCQYDYDCSLMDFCEWLDDAPTIEAVPVVHGEWVEENRRPRSTQFVCSVCHRTAYDPQPTRDPKWVKRCRYAYCPNCGAKMEVQE